MTTININIQVQHPKFEYQNPNSAMLSFKPYSKSEVFDLLMNYLTSVEIKSRWVKNNKKDEDIYGLKLYKILNTFLKIYNHPNAAEWLLNFVHHKFNYSNLSIRAYAKHMGYNLKTLDVPFNILRIFYHQQLFPFLFYAIGAINKKEIDNMLSLIDQKKFHKILDLVSAQNKRECTDGIYEKFLNSYRASITTGSTMSTNENHLVIENIKTQVYNIDAAMIEIHKDLEKLL